MRLQFLVLSKPLAILIERLSEETVADPVLKQVVDILQIRWPEKKGVSKGLLLYFHVQSELYLWGNQWIEKVLQLAHEGPFGIVKCKQRVRAIAWWPKVDKHCELYFIRKFG